MTALLIPAQNSRAILVNKSLSITTTTLKPISTPIPCMGPVSLQLPFYYSDDMVFQMGPSSHWVWGYTTNPKCNILVTETCDNGFGEIFKTK